MTHYVRLVFLGDYATMRRAIKEIRGDILGVVTMFNKMAALGPAAVGIALTQIPLAFGALGLAATAETAKVSAAYAEFISYIKIRTAELAKPFEDVWLHMFENARGAFDRISPILQGIFEHVAPFVQRLSDHIVNLAEHAMPAFAVIVERTSPLIDVLGVGLEKVAHGFMQMLITISEETPAAAQAMESLFNLLAELLPIIGQIIAVLVEGFGPILGEITFAIERLAFAVLDFATHLAAAGPAISSILQTMFGLFAGLLKVLGPLVEALLNALAPILKEAANLVWMLADTIGAILAPILTALSGPLTMVIKALADGLRPALFALEKAFALLMPPLEAALHAIGTLLVKAIETVAPFLPPLIAFLGRIVESFLAWIPPLLRIAEDLLPILGNFLGIIINEGLIPMGDAMLGLANDLMPLLIDILAQVVDILVVNLAPILMEVARTLFPALLDIVNALVPVFVDIARAVLPALVDIFKSLMPLVNDLARIIFPLLVDIIKNLVVPMIKNVLGPALVWIAENVMPALVWVIKEILVPILKVLVEGVKFLADGFSNILIPAITAVANFLGGALVGAVNIAKGLFTSLKEGIMIGYNAVITFFTELPGKILALIAGLPSALFNAGAGMIQSFADGINSKALAAQDAAGNVVGGTAALFPQSPAKTGPFSGSGYTLYSGQRLIEDWVRGMQSVDLGAMVAGVVNGAKAALGFTSDGAGGGTARAEVAGVGALELKVAPGADSALASLLMNMVRSGQLQLQRV